MPKAYITLQQQKNNELAALIYGSMKVNGITQSGLARALGISQPGVSDKLRRKSFSYEDLVTIFDVCGLTDEQIVSVMRKEKK